MTRLLPAVGAGLCCAFAGMHYAQGLRARAKSLRRWEGLLRHLALLLSDGTDTLPECLEYAATDKGREDETLRALAAMLRREPFKTLEEAYEAQPLPESEVLRRCLKRLERGSAEERAQAAEHAADEMKLLYDAAAARARVDAKMWSSLGWTLGACVTLLLI